MQYIALLRGINVGNSVKVNMQDLKIACESLGLRQVSTYINSGNILFISDESKEVVLQKTTEKLLAITGQEIKVLIKTREEMRRIASAIPAEWTNDAVQKTDVLYLFAEIDNQEIIKELPIKKEYVNINYVKGAIILNVQRDNATKSQINKLATHKRYKQMTIRNVNTARYLANFEHSPTI